MTPPLPQGLIHEVAQCSNPPSQASQLELNMFPSSVIGKQIDQLTSEMSSRPLKYLTTVQMKRSYYFGALYSILHQFTLSLYYYFWPKINELQSFKASIYEGRVLNGGTWIIGKVCRSKKFAEQDFKYLAGDEDRATPKSYSISIIVLQ